MKPESCSKLTRGLAIGAASLSLNACGNKDLTEMPRSDEVVAVDQFRHGRLKECLQKGNEEASLTYTVAYNMLAGNKDSQESKTLIPGGCGCNAPYLIVDLKDCSVASEKMTEDTVRCESNGEGVWDTKETACTGKPTLAISKDEKDTDPDTWKKAQAMCDERAKTVLSLYRKAQ